MTRSSTSEKQRRLVAQEAARIIVTRGLRDYHAAKIKAAERLGINARGSLPGNREIEREIESYHQIFGGESHEALLTALRVAAVSAMRLLEDFSPRLVGPVLRGTADENSAINLHVFADSPEEVAHHLAGLKISSRSYERRLRARKDTIKHYPGYEFQLNDAVIQATVFPIVGIRQAPLSPVDGRPMQRADTNQVAALQAVC